MIPGSLGIVAGHFLHGLQVPPYPFEETTVLLLQALESKVLLDTAMSLYGLEHSELYWEKAQVVFLLDNI